MMMTLSLFIFGLGQNLRSQMQARNDFLQSELVIAIHELHQFQRELLRLYHEVLTQEYSTPKTLKHHRDLVQSRITIIQRRLLASRDQQQLNSENSQELQTTIESWSKVKDQLEELQKNPQDIRARKQVSTDIESLELALNQLIRTNQEQQWKEYQSQLKSQEDSLNQLTILLGFYFAFATFFFLYTLNFIETRQRLLEEMRKESTTDELTQIANRRCFNQTLKREWNRILREENTIVLILCDIDYFKQYNDYYGHQAGDRCLHQIAQALAAGVRRSGEFVARYGGEEFVIVASSLTTNQVQELSAHLHRQIRQLALEHCRSLIGNCVTISMGIAVGVPTLKLSPENALSYADQALYEAKSRGRNQSYLHVFGDAVV